MRVWVKRHPVWSWVIGVLVLLVVVGAASGSPEEKSAASDSAVKSGGAIVPTADPVAAESTPEPTPTPTPKPDVALRVTRPGGTVHEPTVRVSGRATRGATVKIGGHRVAVRRGYFERTLTLKHGANAFSVRASKRGMTTAETTVRVTRRLSASEKAAIARAKAARIAARITSYKANAAPIPYNQLNKDADRYKGKRVKFSGQILQIQEDEHRGGFMLLSVTDLGYGIYDDNVWVDYDRSIRSAEGDVVTVYGSITGSKSYETQIGGETYVPQMHARYIDE